MCQSACSPAEELYNRYEDDTCLFLYRISIFNITAVGILDLG